MLLLVTPMAHDQLATVATRKIVTQLEGRGAAFVQVDGTRPENREVRSALWALAGAAPGTWTSSAAT